MKLTRIGVLVFVFLMTMSQFAFADSICGYVQTLYHNRDNTIEQRAEQLDAIIDLENDIDRLEGEISALNYCAYSDIASAAAYYAVGKLDDAGVVLMCRDNDMNRISEKEILIDSKEAGIRTHQRNFDQFDDDLDDIEERLRNHNSATCSSCIAGYN